MKKIIFTLLVVYAGLCNAQNWCPPGAEWKYSSYSFGGYSNLKFNYEKDTIVIQKACKKIIGREIYVAYGPPGIPPMISDTVSLEPLFSYSNNDTVFFFQNNAFYPVYNFHVKLGDTLIYENPIVKSQKIQQLVDSVGVVVINGIPLKYYSTQNTTIDNDQTDPPHTAIMERFGALDNYILLFYASVTEVYYNLLCYKDDLFPLYQKDPKLACDLISSVSNILDVGSVRLSPNPANDKVAISNSSDDNIKTILLYDICGTLRKIIDNSENSSGISIDLNNLQNGMYIIQIWFSSGNVITNKFIKD